MQLSKCGVEFLKREEGLSLTPYADGPGQSIGYGHFIRSGIDDWMLDGITAAQAERIFRQDLAERYEPAVRSAIRVPMRQQHYDMFVGICYNIGVGGFAGANFVREYNQRNGRVTGESRDAFNVSWRSWKNSGGREHPVLVARRERELKVFHGGHANPLCNNKATGKYADLVLVALAGAAVAWISTDEGEALRSLFRHGS